MSIKGSGLARDFVLDDALNESFDLIVLVEIVRLRSLSAVTVFLILRITEEALTSAGGDGERTGEGEGVI